MIFVKGILLLQLSSFCRAQLFSTTQVSPTNSSRTTTEGNLTHLEEKVDYNPYIEALSGKCHWTLKIPFGEVPLDAALGDRLVPQICQELGCGGVYNVKKNNYASSNASCFSECFYEEGQLRNCSMKEAKGCVVISEAVCGAHMVRLSGGRDRCEGRVELWRGEQWGSVCDDQWDLREAEVVCRQTGCGFALSVSGQGGQFPLGTGPVLLDDLNCTGAEANLWDCPAAQGTDCGHKEDAGVVCSEMRAVRLSGGTDRCSGKVEIHRNGTWGTVCDTCWNRDIASTVCSMLRCGPEPQSFTQFNPPLSHNPGPLYFYHRCPTGPNSTLWDCREIINNKYACKDTKASGVICNGSLGFPDATTTAKSITLTTATVTDVTTLSPVEWFPLPSLPLLCVASVALLLFVFLIVNTVLCCHYRNRHAFLVQQSQMSHSSKSKPRRNSNEVSVDLTKVTTNPDTVPFASKPLWMQLSVDSSSVDTDFEPSEASLSTFRNSQRHRVDRNPLMRPLGLDSLREEEERGAHAQRPDRYASTRLSSASESKHGAVGDFSSCNGPDYSRTSRINSFDSSSTSSEEPYRNTSPHSAAQTNEAVEEDEGPIYSPVSPETDTSSGEDYDDVGC